MRRHPPYKPCVFKRTAQSAQLGIGFLHELSNLRSHISPNISFCKKKKKKKSDFNENLGFGLAVHTEFVKFGENFT